MKNGDICNVNLDGIGTEQKGQHPAIVLKVFNKTDLTIVIPLTSNLEVLEKYPLTCIIRATSQTGLKTDSVAQIFQLKACHRSRFTINREGNVLVFGSISEEDKKIINDLISSEIQFS